MGRLGPAEAVSPTHTNFLVASDAGTKISCAVYWDPKDILFIPYKDFSKTRMRERGLEWAGQLRTSYFLQLQRDVLTNVERVGLPVHPAEATPVEIQVFVRAPQNKASMLFRVPKEKKMGFTFVGREPPSSRPTVKTRPKDIFTLDPSFTQILYDSINKKLRSASLSDKTNSQLQRALDEAAEFLLFQDALSLSEFNNKLDHIRLMVAHSEEDRLKQRHKMNHLLVIQLIHPRPKKN